MTVYIQGKSKASINRLLTAGIPITGIEYTIRTITYHNFNALNNGTVVKVFEKFISGSPFAKSYGTVKNGKII